LRQDALDYRIADLLAIAYHRGLEAGLTAQAKTRLGLSSDKPLHARELGPDFLLTWWRGFIWSADSPPASAAICV